MLVSSPRPFACAVSFIALAARIPLTDWRDVILPRHRELVRTPEYQAARPELADVVDALGYPTARDLLVRRARQVAGSIASFATRGRQSGLDARAAGEALAAAALAVWARERLTPEQFALLKSPLERMIPSALPR